MCGIVGWVKTGALTSSRALVKAMADRIAHRGPDDEGFYFAPGVGLGHRRLSIIDVEGGHQPMITADGRFVIIYNGEVYNFKELRKNLEAQGHTFITRSDTEVVLRSYQQWGTRAFEMFRGMFACAIWDGAQQVLCLARDHLGIKPLYYVRLNDELIFASEIKTLFCHPRLARRIDPKVLVSFLTLNNIVGDSSLWQDVKRCLPGEYLLWQKGSLERYRYFDVANLKTAPFEGSFEDAAVSYKRELSASVDGHLISDVPVGAYVSSGFDSASVALLANRDSNKTSDVFTGYFEGHEDTWYDERPAAMQLAARYGLRQHFCKISAKDFDEHFDHVMYHLDEPTLGSGAIPHFILARAASSAVKVVLTGHGGDELYAGYPVFKAVALRGGGLSQKNLANYLPSGADEWIRFLYFYVGGFIDPIVARGQLRLFLASVLKRVVSADLWRLIKGSGDTDAFFERMNFPETRWDVDKLTRWYAATYLPTLLIQEDKVSMANGLESRVPICYMPLLKLALSLPAEMKIRAGRLKAVPRRAMCEDLPPVFYSQPKRGFPTPIVSWLSGSLGSRWQGAWQDALPGPLDGLLDTKGVCREFERFQRWGTRMPAAYSTAHRLVSLQMVYGCAKTMASLTAVEDLDGAQEGNAGLKGPLVLC